MRLLRFARPATSVFISYRRDDSLGYAGRLHDALRREFGTERVRMDLDDFQAGGEFALEAKQMIAGSDVVLVLIGRRWADERNAARLADPSDLLRQEIETALEKGVRVIPVLLNGAALPDAAVLPDSLQPLLQRNAFEVTERRWDDDVRDLIVTLRGRGMALWRLAAAAAVVVALMIGGMLYWNGRDDAEGSASLSPVVRRNDGSVFSIDHDRFFAAYDREFGALKPEARPVLEGFLSMVDADTGLADIRWAAYILATIKHEGADTWLPIEEPGKGRGRPYADTVVVTDPEGREYRNSYYGRGYIQLTWDDNYRTMGNLLGNRLLYEPDLALEPSVSYRMLSLAMRRGMFTGRSLARFINDSTCDYVNARKIVNGLDQAQRIAADAVRMERILRESTPPPPPEYTAATPLYVRSAPEMSQPGIGDPIPRGTVVRELEKRNEWVRVTVSSPRLTGWVPGSFLRPTAASGETGPTCTTGLDSIPRR